MNLQDSADSENKIRRVLIAEDDSVVRLILESWLQLWGYQVEFANDGDEAWNILQQENPPALVILDWMMPGLDGIELCRRLRDSSREYYHYILMITGQNAKQDIAHALESGADDCLSKPFQEPELRARLMVANRILSLQDELIKTREDLRVQATRDALTGLWNRVAFLDLFARELDRAKRCKSATGLLLLDLDHFKEINDTYGHLVGDQVLREAAQRLLRKVRSYDFVGRYGGEEFLIVFPGCDRRQIREQAERVRLAISDKPIRVGEVEISLTASIGAAVAPSGERACSDVIAVADVALYKAKGAGRNRAVCCERSWSEVLESPNSHHACCAQCDPVLSGKCIL